MLGAAATFHMDFGSGLFNGAPIGIPYVVVPSTQATVPVVFDEPDESDPGPYPIPADAPIEGGPDSDGDRHVIALQAGTCRLYELFYAFPQNQGASWTAFSGAMFDLDSNVLRPLTWTSADAAGLPILPGLARYDEVAAGRIEHALRFTTNLTQRAFVWPARHFASSNTNPNLPPMGQRFRLKASVNIEGFSPQARVIARAMKEYGIILADNGSPWFVSGVPDSRWNNTQLRELRSLRGDMFEAVDTRPLIISESSGQACQPGDSDGDGAPNCIEPLEAINPTVKDNDVFQFARLFVMQQYRDFLAREGDPQGLFFWSSHLDIQHFSRGQVIEAFFNSAEFQGVLAPIARLYFAYFLRIPDAGGVTFWGDQYRNGVPLATIANAFATSDEFLNRYGSLSNEDFVSLVYFNVLNRAPDTAGFEYWTGQLNSGARTRGEVMLGFSESDEFKFRMSAETFVTLVYMGMLRRAPEQGGFDFWVNYIDTGNSGLALIDGFLGSTEYRQRFLP